jgi:hypothetical protein
LGVLALLGSGEIAPSMTKVHRQLLKRVDPVRAVSLDTAYGFQANVPQMTEKIVDYFATSLRVPIEPLHFTVFEGTSEVERAAFRQDVRAANYVFAGPGSPSYALHQWAPLGPGRGPSRDAAGRRRALLRVGRGAHAGLRDRPGLRDLQGRHRGPLAARSGRPVAWPASGAPSSPTTTTPKAATTTPGSATSAKSGSSNSNANCPTRRGSSASTSTLPASSTSKQRTLTVMGKGGVYWRRKGSTRTFESGSVTALDELQSFEPESAAPLHPQLPELNDVDALVVLAQNGGPESIDAIARLARMASTGGSDRIDPSELVEGLLELRVNARDAKDFALADRIRDVLVTSGIEVMDTPDGSKWSIK